VKVSRYLIGDVVQARHTSGRLDGFGGSSLEIQATALRLRDIAMEKHTSTICVFGNRAGRTVFGTVELDKLN
jgi:hypothetical protein